MQLITRNYAGQWIKNFNLLFEANFYATIMISLRKDIFEFNFNLLFEANFYATNIQNYRFGCEWFISIFFLKLISMQHEEKGRGSYCDVCISIFFLKLISMQLALWRNYCNWCVIISIFFLKLISMQQLTLFV